MPRPQRKLKDRRPELGEGHRCQLETGHSFNMIVPDFGEHPDPQELAAAWEQLGACIMEQWTRERPGTRCWYWWEALAPQRRPRIDGHAHPFDDEDRKKKIAVIGASLPVGKVRDEYLQPSQALWFGCPRELIVQSDFGAEYESERDYLARLDLLTAAERKALAAMATV